MRAARSVWLGLAGLLLWLPQACGQDISNARIFADKLAELCWGCDWVRDEQLDGFADLALRHAEAPADLALKAEDAWIRAGAALAMRQTASPDKAFVALLGALGDPEEVVIEAAAIALGTLGDERALPFLIPLCSHGSYRLRAAACLAVGQLGDRKAIDVLVDAARNDGSWQVRAAAVTALGYLEYAEGLPLFEQLRRDDPCYQVAAAALWAVGHANCQEAFEMLLQSCADEVHWVRQAAALGLGELGDARALLRLVELLGDGTSQVRAGAARALGMLGDRQAVEWLIRLLDEGVLQVRAAAAESLGMLRAQEAVPKLIDLLARDVSPAVRSAAAWSLGEMQAAEAVESLLVALTKPNATLRIESASALGKIGDPRAIRGLREALSGDEEPLVRAWAAWALGALKAEAALSDLRSALSHPASGVREQAATALARLPNARSAIPDLERLAEDKRQPVSVREAAKKALEALAAPAVAP